MNIRRDRLHQCGLTNLDFRTKGDIESLDRYQPSLRNTNFGTMGKSQYKRLSSAVDFKDQVAMTSGFKHMMKLNPKAETTTNFYKNRGKKMKQPVQIGKKKENELEEEQWTDKVFTGDNPKLTAFLSGKARDREAIFNADYKKRRTQQQDPSALTQSTDNLKHKEDVHAEAEQET